MRKLAEFLFVSVSLVALSLFFVVAIFDLAGGCGETFQYADGTLHQGECLGRELLTSFLGDL